MKPNCFNWLVFTSRASTHNDTVGCRAKRVNAFYSFRGIHHTCVHTSILLGMCNTEKDLIFKWKNGKLYVILSVSPMRSRLLSEYRYDMILSTGCFSSDRSWSR